MDATESARVFALPSEGLALVEGVSGAAGGVDARGEAGVAARHVGVVRRSVVAERVRGAAAGRDVGRGLQMIHGFGLLTDCANQACL